MPTKIPLSPPDFCAKAVKCIPRDTGTWVVGGGIAYSIQGGRLCPSRFLCESREMYSMVLQLWRTEKKKHRGVIDVEVPDIDKLPSE